MRSRLCGWLVGVVVRYVRVVLFCVSSLMCVVGVSVLMSCIRVLCLVFWVVCMMMMLCRGVGVGGVSLG